METLEGLRPRYEEHHGISPHSLGKPIKWKLSPSQIPVNPREVKVSPLAGETN